MQEEPTPRGDDNESKPPPSPWAAAAGSAAPSPGPSPARPRSPDRETWVSVALGMLLGAGGVLLLGALFAILT